MKSSESVNINAPAKTVFLWLEDDERLKKWVPNIIVDEAIIETPEKVGSTFRQVFLERGKEMEMFGEITAYVENERMRVDMKGDMFNLDVDYLLTSTGDAQTELTQHTEINFKGFMKLFTPIFILMAKFGSNKAQAEAHATLKRMAEAEYNSL